MTVTPRIKLDAPLEDIQRSMNVITTAVSRLSNKAEHLVTPRPRASPWASAAAP